MKRTDRALDKLRIASPCSAAWNDMAGDERVRFCHLCRLNVYNVSAMTHREADDLIHGREGRLCVTYWQRADGTVLTADCPIGLREIPQKLAGLCAALVGIFIVLLAGGSWSPIRHPTTMNPGAGLRYAFPFAHVLVRFATPPPTAPLGVVVAAPNLRALQSPPSVRQRTGVLP